MFKNCTTLSASKNNGKVYNEVSPKIMEVIVSVEHINNEAVYVLKA